MKISYGIFMLSLLLFQACEKQPRKILVRPILDDASNADYSKVFPFDTHPTLDFGRRWLGKKLTHENRDTLFLNRLRVKPKGEIIFDVKATFPAVTLDVIMPDSVRLGDGFYYVLVIKAMDKALFSRMHIDEVSQNEFEVRLFQQEVENIKLPLSEFEETMNSYFPLEKGVHKFGFYYYDSLLIQREVLVY